MRFLLNQRIPQDAGPLSYLLREQARRSPATIREWFSLLLNILGVHYYEYILAEAVSYMTTFEDLYVAEIRRQCIFALFAYQDMRNELVKDPGSWNQPRIWYSLQNFLVAAANISKLLWGQNSGTPFRQAVRARLGVNNASPLYSRELRNHMEHFDERMIDWNDRSVGHNYVDSNFGIPLANWAPIDIQRNYEPVRNEFIYRGISYELTPLVDAIELLKTESEK